MEGGGGRVKGAGGRGTGGSTNRAADRVVVCADGVHVARAVAIVAGCAIIPAEDVVSGTDASPVYNPAFGKATAGCGKRSRAQCGKDRDESRGLDGSGRPQHRDA